MAVVQAQAQSLRAQRCRDTGRANRTHGMTDTPTYRSWRSMLDRCSLEKHTAFKRYGGRGINVCSRWVRSFAAFLADMGQRPSLAHTLDRRDNNKGYYRRNCRWATRKEQARNRRGARYLTIDGLRLSIGDWIERAGMQARRSTVYWRLRHGWAPRRALALEVL